VDDSIPAREIVAPAAVKIPSADATRPSAWQALP
jgi:hypothetical protein